MIIPAINNEIHMPWANHDIDDNVNKKSKSAFDVELDTLNKKVAPEKPPIQSEIR